MTRVVSWLLNIFYAAMLVVCAPFILLAAVRTGKYRDGYREKFLGRVPRRESDATGVWIHAVSVGEVNLLSTIIRELRSAHPDWQIVVSTTSSAGYELARKKYADLTVFYCPLDFSWAVRTAMRQVRPSLLLLVELELWPNLILAAKEQGARVAIINGRMSDKSYPGYRRIRPLVARLLQQVDLIAAQNKESADRFQALGAPADRVRVTGSLKYDGAQTDRHNPRTQALRELAGFRDDEVVFLAGSTQEPEEQIAIDIYRRLVRENPRLRLVLVPRHPSRFDDVAKLLDDSKLEWSRRSELRPTPPAEPGAAVLNCQLASPQPQRRQPPALPGVFRPILLVDTVGELGAWWGTATIAFVGGSFGRRGGQNMIEPAAYGAAVCFGPNTSNFRDIVAALLDANAAIVVGNGAELEAFVRRSLDQPRWAAAFGARAQTLVGSQLGATVRTVALLESLIQQSNHQSDCRFAA